MWNGHGRPPPRFERRWWEISMASGIASQVAMCVKLKSWAREAGKPNIGTPKRKKTWWRVEIDPTYPHYVASNHEIAVYIYICIHIHTYIYILGTNNIQIDPTYLCIFPLNLPPDQTETGSTPCVARLLSTSRGDATVANQVIKDIRPSMGKFTTQPMTRYQRKWCTLKVRASLKSIDI